MRMKSGIAVAAVALMVAACASEPAGPRGRGPGGAGFGQRGGPPGRFGDEDGDGPRRPRMQLFISPDGQPFRAPADRPYPVGAWFAQADADHDGRLTLDEFRADADSWFKTLDADGDGRIDMLETRRWEEAIVPEVTRAGMGFAAGGPGRRGHGRPSGRGEALDTRRQGAAAYSLINEPHPIRGADADYSLSVDRKEWRAAADRRFALLDVDGDGAIRLSDLPPTPAQSAPGPGRGGRERRHGPPG